MRTTMRRLASLTLLSFPLVLAAQGKNEPKRPNLGGADTNSARAYYDFGIDNLRKDPKAAANAFYWSTRLDPTQADAFYARRVAMLLNLPSSRLTGYWQGERSTMRRAEIQAIDSLYLRALTLNPFLYEKLERHLQDAVIQIMVTGSSNGVVGADMLFEIDRYLRRAGAGEQAFRAYTEGSFDAALKHYANAIKEARYKYYYRTMRGRLFAQLGTQDSALTELKLAVEDMRKRDEKDLIYVYQSKALLEHSIGVAHERNGDKAAAREAYGRALQEDLGYSPAHVQLSYMAIDAKDTTTALSEFDLAVQLRADDAGLRYAYGFLLSAAKKDAEAEEQFKKALELNAVFAPPHLGLGALYDRQSKVPEAIASYRTFLARASALEPRRVEAEARLKALAPK